MSVFGVLEVYRDSVPRWAAMNMAIDEGLLQTAAAPTIRFYRWDHPALSFGYFGKFGDLAEFRDRDLVRRWTGGGIVLHGDDLTYSLVIPASNPAFLESSTLIYEKVHRALCDALAATGIRATVAGIAGPGAKISGITDAGYNGRCFANPVRADVMLNGNKIAGAAQRRTKRGLLQQGSIQNVDLADDFEMNFARSLSDHVVAKFLDQSLLTRAEEISAHRYATEVWIRRR